MYNSLCGYSDRCGQLRANVRIRADKLDRYRHDPHNDDCFSDRDHDNDHNHNHRKHHDRHAKQG